jgi:NAD(P)-dependent dehydrogenase (short-subunit alcohol dehydrogenase family)
MARDWGPKGVRVNALVPGPFESTAAHRDTEREEQMRAVTVLGRIGVYGEIVAPALYLASDASSFMTGAVLSVDGGMMT